jgi:hypothetical protein
MSANCICEARPAFCDAGLPARAELSCAEPNVAGLHSSRAATPREALCDARAGPACLSLYCVVPPLETCIPTTAGYPKIPKNLDGEIAGLILPTHHTG